MQLERLIAALAPTDVVGDGALEIRELAYDAREVPRDSLFFCVPGAKADGHDFAAEALERGAAALVVERRLELEAPQLVVPSVRAAMPRAAVEFFGDPTARLPVAAITGTNGKTTTAYLLWSILAAAGEQPGLLTNVERRVGTEVREVGLNTPESIDLQRLFGEMLDQGNRACVMEATSMASAKGRLEGTRFAVLVFTNLTQDHLDFHGTMEEYFESKRRLFAQADRAVVNVGDEYGQRLAAELPDAITFRPRGWSRRAGSEAPWALQHRERARCGRRRARLSGSARSRSSRASRPSTAYPDASTGSTRDSRSRCSSTTRIRPERSRQRSRLHASSDAGAV